MENDLISRQAAIDAIRASTSKYTGFMEMEMYTDDDAVEAIEGLPSAQPERKEGCWMTKVYEYGDGEEVADRWVECEAYPGGDAAYCSECKGVAGLDGSEEYSLTQFCPHCGIKMKNAEK